MIYGMQCITRIDIDWNVFFVVEPLFYLIYVI
jgi:hypothetical protein